MTKSNLAKCIIREWWYDCRAQGRQLANISMYVERVVKRTRPQKPHVKWKTKIAKSLMYQDFIKWAGNKDTGLHKEITPILFFQLFPLVAVRDIERDTTMTVDGIRTNAYEFKPRSQNVENSRVVEHSHN